MRGGYPKNMHTCYTGPYTHHEKRISCQMKFALLWPQHDMIGNHLSMISGSSGNDETGSGNGGAGGGGRQPNNIAFIYRPYRASHEQF